MINVLEIINNESNLGFLRIKFCKISGCDGGMHEPCVCCINTGMSELE